MIRPIDLCYWACIACYKPITPDIFDQILTVEDVTICLKYEGGDTVVTFPGSEKALDWRDDFEAVPYEHPSLGTLHWGFWKFIPEVVDTLAPLIRGNLYIGGHSLGGAHAAGAAAEFGLRGVRTKYLAMFESPRVGCETFAAYLPTVVAGGVLTWNGIDPVDLCPPPPWCNNWQITHWHGKPGGLEDLNPFAYHLGGLVYRTALTIPAFQLAV